MTLEFTLHTRVTRLSPPGFFFLEITHLKSSLCNDFVNVTTTHLFTFSYLVTILARSLPPPKNPLANSTHSQTSSSQPIFLVRVGHELSNFGLALVMVIMSIYGYMIRCWTPFPFSQHVYIYSLLA
jgi:hypothetical protein